MRRPSGGQRPEASGPPPTQPSAPDVSVSILPPSPPVPGIRMSHAPEGRQGSVTPFRPHDFGMSTPPFPLAGVTSIAGRKWAPGAGGGGGRGGRVLGPRAYGRDGRAAGPHSGRARSPGPRPGRGAPGRPRRTQGFEGALSIGGEELRAAGVSRPRLGARVRGRKQGEGDPPALRGRAWNETRCPGGETSGAPPGLRSTPFC